MPSFFPRLRLLRGKAPRAGRCKVVVENEAEEDILTATVELEDGVLELTVPPDLAKTAHAARVYFLSSSGQLTKSALLLQLTAKGGDGDAPIASQRLRALGFFPKEPAEEESLDLAMALAAYQRTAKAKDLAEEAAGM